MRRVRAFTLVELLVVIAIIALLLSMLVPALANARNQAKSAATKAMLTTLDTGLEAFRNDNVVGNGGYPPSVAAELPVPGYNRTQMCPPVHPSQGAELLVWAMVGADLLGTPGFPNNWQTFCDANPALNPAGLYALDATNKPMYTRAAPFLDMSKTKVVRRGDAMPVGPGAPALAMCLLDTFDRPVLYYRAYAGATNIADYRTDYSVSASYQMADNATFTGDSGASVSGMDLGGGANHPLGQWVPLNNQGWPDLNNAQTKRSFGYLIWDQKITARPMAQRPDTYLLISAGVDGRYGTADDVTNFAPNR